MWVICERQNFQKCDHSHGTPSSADIDQDTDVKQSANSLSLDSGRSPINTDNGENGDKSLRTGLIQLWQTVTAF